MLLDTRMQQEEDHWAEVLMSSPACFRRLNRMIGALFSSILLPPVRRLAPFLALTVVVVFASSVASQSPPSTTGHVESFVKITSEGVRREFGRSVEIWPRGVQRLARSSTQIPPPI